MTEQFNRWTFEGTTKRVNGKWKCLCTCNCGNQRWVDEHHLKSGHSKSCGCLKSETTARRNYVHGFADTPTGATWYSMLARCYRADYNNFKNYGGKGIKVCEFLRASPFNLVALIGIRPSRSLSVDRIDNLGHYTCGACAECMENKWPMNVRWTTQKQQTRNQKKNCKIRVGDQVKCMSEWAEDLGLAQTAIRRHNARKKILAKYPDATVEFLT